MPNSDSQMGRVAVITGASDGIGAALARTLGAEGYRLVLAARGQEALEKVVAAVAPAGHAIAVRTDVTRRAEVERLRDRAFAAFGQVDVWVNNAGRGISCPALQLTDEDLDEMMAVNVKSALYGMQAIIPHFIERGTGHVVNVSSFLGRVPIATIRSGYNAAKAALNALTANVRVDLRAQAPGVHVSLVMPGVVTTDFAKHAIGAPPGAPPSAASMAAGGSQTVEQVAAVMAQLLREPVAEVYTNPAQVSMVERYFHDVAGFEADMAARAMTGGRR